LRVVDLNMPGELIRKMCTFVMIHLDHAAARW
jgi:hypothetical protein